MNTVPLLVYPLLYPWLILCDLCPGFQDDACLLRLSLHSVACSTPCCCHVNREDVCVQTSIMTVVNGSAKQVPGHFNATEDMSAASCLSLAKPFRKVRCKSRCTNGRSTLH